jgi:hypothetical protein
MDTAILSFFRKATVISVLGLAACADNGTYAHCEWSYIGPQGHTLCGKYTVMCKRGWDYGPYDPKTGRQQCVSQEGQWKARNQEIESCVAQNGVMSDISTRACLPLADPKLGKDPTVAFPSREINETKGTGRFQFTAGQATIRSPIGVAAIGKMDPNYPLSTHLSVAIGRWLDASTPKASGGGRNTYFVRCSSSSTENPICIRIVQPEAGGLVGYHFDVGPLWPEGVRTSPLWRQHR